MLMYSFDTDHAVLTVHPETSLSAGDFGNMTAEVDAYIEEHGALAGLIFLAPTFQGWDSFGAFTEHIRFIRDHHKLIRRVALVTDSPVADAVQAVGRYFAGAKVRHFAGEKQAEAEDWVRGMAEG